jgi:hypothetical protein
MCSVWNAVFYMPGKNLINKRKEPSGVKNFVYLHG